MQLPPDLLQASDLSAHARLVLSALWGVAEQDSATPIPWAASLRHRDMARAAGVPFIAARRAITELRTGMLIRPRDREVAGRKVSGWELMRSPRVLTMSSTTLKSKKKSVVAKARELTANERDFAQIDRYCRADDSAATLAAKLIARKAPCSTGRWYPFKVTRRVWAMAAEMGITEEGLGVGEVVERWRRTR